MMTIGEVQASYDTNLADIASKSGISKATLSRAFNRPVSTLTIQILNGVAAAINESPEKDDRYLLAINDQAQTIQGVRIPDLTTYRNVKFVVKSNVMEGWQPHYSDVKGLTEFTEAAHPELEQKFKDIFGD